MPRPALEPTPVVLIHGFGFHSFVWHSLASELSGDYTSRLIDLPGYNGTSCAPSAPVFESLLPHEGAHWVGWSMGGLVALQAMAHGTLPRSLSLIAAQPRMCAGDDWPDAIQTKTFQQFRRRIQDHPAQGLRHFAALVAHGDPHATVLRRQLAHTTPPRPCAIDWGLELLEHTDLRQQWATPSVPQQLILGDNDALIPARAATALKPLHPDTPITVLNNTGHALPLSAAERCAKILREFWDTVP